MKKEIKIPPDIEIVNLFAEHEELSAWAKQIQFHPETTEKERINAWNEASRSLARVNKLADDAKKNGIALDLNELFERSKSVRIEWY